MDVLVLISTYNTLINTASIYHDFIGLGYDTNPTNNTGIATGGIIDDMAPRLIFT